MATAKPGERPAAIAAHEITAIAKVTEHPDFRDVSERLSSYVRAYDPDTWRSPKDAMAQRFYLWERDPAG